MDQDPTDPTTTTDQESANPHCAACGASMTKVEEFGTNADGSRNEEYCCRCMQGGNRI